MNSSYHTTRIAIVAGLAALLCFGCAPRNSLPVVSVHVKISFVDAHGTDKVKGLDLHNQSGYKEVNSKLYQATVSALPEHEIGLAPLAVDQQNSGDFLCFDIGLGMVRGDYHLRSTEVTLTCAHIFGDDQPHKVTMHWNDQMSCTKIDYNGKSFPAVKDPDDYRYYGATVVID